MQCPKKNNHFGVMPSLIVLVHTIFLTCQTWAMCSCPCSDRCEPPAHQGDSWTSSPDQPQALAMYFWKIWGSFLFTPCADFFSSGPLWAGIRPFPRNWLSHWCPRSTKLYSTKTLAFSESNWIFDLSLQRSESWKLLPPSAAAGCWCR